MTSRTTCKTNDFETNTLMCTPMRVMI